MDIVNLTIKQWSKLGVRTKFKKHATTYLIEIPDLIEVISNWDKEVRQVCGNNGYWFVPISPETGKIISGTNGVGEFRSSRARKGLQDWLYRVKLPYHSPHKFRHGNAVYSLKRAKDIPALKAVSQNLMHSNISITDGVYGILNENDVKKQISELGKKLTEINESEIVNMLPILEKIVAYIRNENVTDHSSSIFQ